MVRQILLILPYQLPPAQEGLDFLTADPHALREAALAQGDVSLVQGLIAATQGIGKYTAQEVELRSGFTGQMTLMDLTAARKVEEAIGGIQQEIRQRLDGTDPTVTAQIDSRNRMKNLVPYTPLAHPEWTRKVFPSL